MSAVPKRKLTAAQYLAIEEKAEYKSEFFDGEMFAMAGASPPHCFIVSNLVLEVGMRLKGGPCRTASNDLRVLVERTGLRTYPDLVILCGTPEYDPEDRNTLLNPTAIIEVLSPSTEHYDRGSKFRNYQQIPSMQEYVLVEQDEAVCERYNRLYDGTWSRADFVGLGESLVLKSVPVSIPMVDIYSGVALPQASPK